MFDSLQALPPDPILALTPAYRADPNPDKIDLGAGVYKDENGNTPVMRAVKQAEQTLLAEQDSKAYVGAGGAAGFNEAIASLAFGETLKRSLGERRVSLQTPGGCGGLRLAAEFIAQANPDATVWVSDPPGRIIARYLARSGLKSPPTPITTLTPTRCASTPCSKACPRRPPATSCCCTAAATIPAGQISAVNNGGKCATWPWTRDSMS